jgi:hypothetical protein
MNPKMILSLLAVIALGCGVASGAVLYSVTISGSFTVTLPSN